MLIYTNDYTQINQTSTITFNSPNHIRQKGSQFNKGSAMGETVSHRFPTAQNRVQLQLRPCRICGRNNGTGTGFFSIEFFRLSCQCLVMIRRQRCHLIVVPDSVFTLHYVVPDSVFTLHYVVPDSVFTLHYITLHST